MGVSGARLSRAGGAHEILLDSNTGGRPAGTGAAIERSLARAVAADLDAPLILAGGLTPENVAAAILAVRPAAVDVITSLEDERHRKRPERVDAFLAAARSA